MGEYYIYSNCLGVFVLDESFKLIEKVDIKEGQNFSGWLEEEKALAGKYKGKELFYIGYKKEKTDGIKLTQDPKKIRALINFLKEYKQDIRTRCINKTIKNIRESVNRDNFIIQAIDNIEEIQKAVNLLVKRLREWYELYLPEFSRSLESHEKFVDLILKRDKEKLLKEIELEKEYSMGADLDYKDLKPVMTLAESAKGLYQLRDTHEQYLEAIMKEYCLNVYTLAGTLITAKLIAHARGLMNLAKMPASTVQLLGAEKALFRHLKTGARPPKYGVLFQHPLVSKARKEDKGRAARMLADKISIAARIDVFKGKFIGDKLKQELENTFGENKNNKNQNKTSAETESGENKER
jgi:nucleolar protein 56